MTITKSRRRLISATIRYALLSIWGIVAFFPIYWMVSTSFKPDIQWFAWPPVYFPDPPTLTNYMNVWLGAEQYDQTQYAISSQTPLVSLWNTTVIAFSSTFLAVAFGSVLAYGVSRYRILSEARMFQLLMLRMIPPIVVVAPLSLYYSALGLLDTRIGVIMVYFLTTLPYAVWMTKSFRARWNRPPRYSVRHVGEPSLRSCFR
jgi:multiple sugar transport system permease protein